jgi:polar amino acid transport system substrate-binding protein
LVLALGLLAFGVAAGVGVATWYARRPATGEVLRWGADPTGGGPYIFEKDGRLTGFEVELADYLAAELGRRSQFQQGQWNKLPDLLLRHDIDLVLNGYEWSPEREQDLASTLPYYIYKLQLLARTEDPTLRSWEDLRTPRDGRRKRVGVLSGSVAARFVEQKFGGDVEIKAFDDVINVLGLVERAQDLDATVQDLPVVIFYGPEFPGLRRVGEPVEPGYYVMLVRKEDQELRERLNQALRKGIQDGTLRRIYEKYGIWNADQERLAEIAAQPWPPQGNAAVASRPENPWYYFLTLTRAAGTTVLLSCLAMPLAILLGLAVAVGRLYGPWWLDRLLEGYVEVLRGTPLLLQLFVIYYLLPRWDIRIGAFWAAVLGLAINYSAYEAENYRAGLLAIPKGQMEAALSLGMSTWTALRRIIIPQAVRIVIPPVTNDFIALFKDTSVCSVIAVTELTGRYNQLYNNHPRLVLELGLMTAALYLLMSYPLSLAARRLERRFPRVAA